MKVTQENAHRRSDKGEIRKKSFTAYEKASQMDHTAQNLSLLGSSPLRQSAQPPPARDAWTAIGAPRPTSCLGDQKPHILRSKSSQNPSTRSRMPPHPGREVDTRSDADPKRPQTWLSSRWVRPLRSSFFVWIVVWAVLDLGFGITFSGIARYILPPVVLLVLVLSILDLGSDG